MHFFNKIGPISPRGGPRVKILRNTSGTYRNEATKRRNFFFRKPVIQPSLGCLSKIGYKMNSDPEENNIKFANFFFAFLDSSCPKTCKNMFLSHNLQIHLTSQYIKMYVQKYPKRTFFAWRHLWTTPRELPWRYLFFNIKLRTQTKYSSTNRTDKSSCRGLWYCPMSEKSITKMNGICVW